MWDRCSLSPAIMKLEGVFPILPTPFHDDETFDRESMTAVVRFMRELGVDGITVLGVLGEASRLSDGECELVIRTAVQAATSCLGSRP